MSQNNSTDNPVPDKGHLHEDKEKRKQKLQQLVDSIMATKKTERKSVSKSSSPYTRSGRGRGRRSEYKVPIGWQHFSKEKYRTVMQRNGGGTRYIYRNSGEEITVNEIIEEGKTLYFKDGKSKFGSLEEMTVSLVTSSGQEISEFTDRNGLPCCFTEYVKAYGLYPSQCHLYLRTQLKELSQSDTDECLEKKEKSMCFLVNGNKAGYLEISYRKMTQSVYDNSSSCIVMKSYKTCMSMAKEDLEEYNVFNDGYLVNGVLKGNREYLVDTENVYQCPQFRSDPNEVVGFIHGPDDIHGSETDDLEHLILGCLTIFHNQGHLYNWYKDNELVDSGINHSILRIAEPGTYTVEVEESENVLYRSSPLSVTIENTLNTESQILSTQQQTLNTQTQIIDSQPQTFINQSQTLNIPSQTVHTPQKAFDTPSQTLTFVSNTLSTQTQALHTEPQIFNIPTHTFNSQSQTLNIESQTLNIVQQAFNSEPQAFNIEPQTLNTESQTLNTEPQTLNTEPQTLNTEPQTLNTEPQTLNIESQTLNTEPQTFNTELQTFNTEAQTFNSQSQTLYTQPNTLNTESQTLNTEPQTFNTELQTFNTETQTFNSQSQTLYTQPNTLNTESQTFDVPSQTLNIGSQTLNTVLQTFSTKPHALNTRTNTLSTQPQKCDTQSKRYNTDTLKTVSTPAPSNFNRLQTECHKASTLTPCQKFVSSVSATATLSTLTHSPTVNAQSQPEIMRLPVKSQIKCEQALSQSQTISSVSLPLNKPQANTCNISSVSFNTSCVPKVNLGDLSLGKEIGRGAFGIVFEGIWLKTKVAVKEICVKRLKVIKSFIVRELCLHSQLRHPNIVLLMAYAIENSKLYLVTELIEGDTLDIEDICSCQYDLKIVKLCDMGLSKIKTMNTIMTTMAGGPAQPGTPAYQAPEVLLAKQSANIASDIWSLSCMLVELFTDMPVWNTPEDDQDPVEYIIAQMRLCAKPDGMVALAVTDEYISSLLARGLSYKPDERPHALEIVEHLCSLK